MLLIVCFIFILNPLCFGKVTEKQYASMPELFYQDNYDKCMLLEEDTLYCRFTYELEPVNANNVSKIWKIIKEVSSDDLNYRHDHLRHGICVPFTCPNIEKSNRDDARLAQRITDCYDKKFASVGLKGNVTYISCETNESRYPMDWFDITVAITFICYMGLIVFASIYESINTYKPEKDYQNIASTRWGRIIAAFSIQRNWRRLKTINSNPDIEKLRPFQGVRFYNTVLVILAHTAMSFVMLPTVNTKFTEQITQKIENLFLSSGSLCVSTNFLMSAFFLLHGILSYSEDKKDIGPKFLLNTFIARCIRLTPTLAVTILFHATWLRHLGRGPNWNNLIGKEFLRCRKNWWTNLLYVNNFVDIGNMCLAPTWYLALDTQYFIVLLFIIWFIKKYPKLIWLTLGCLLSTNIIATFIHNYRENYNIILVPKPESVYDMKNVLNNPQFHYQTADIIGCTAGSIIGLGYGYIFFKYKHQKIFSSNLLFHQVLYYVISYGLGLGIILISTIFNMTNKTENDRFWSSVYIASARPIFCLGIGYSLFGATQGLGWLTEYCMRWPPAYILGRLTYSAYLIHMSVVLIPPAIARSPVYIQDFSIIRDLMANICLTYLAALLITLFLELPISELQKCYPSKPEVKVNTKKD